MALPVAGLDPSNYQQGEEYTTMRDAAEYVSLAYERAIDELDVLQWMTRDFTTMASCRDSSQFERNIAKDIERLQRRICISVDILKLECRRFHYGAKRRRTRDRVNRLRWWQKEMQKTVEVEGLRSGPGAQARASASNQQTTRVTVAQYKLERDLSRADRREREAARRRQVDGESSGCETTEPEE